MIDWNKFWEDAELRCYSYRYVQLGLNFIFGLA